MRTHIAVHTTSLQVPKKKKQQPGLVVSPVALLALLALAPGGLEKGVGGGEARLLAAPAITR